MEIGQLEVLVIEGVPGETDRGSGGARAGGFAHSDGLARADGADRAHGAEIERRELSRLYLRNL